VNTVDYIIDLLAGFSVVQSGVVYYGVPENSPPNAKIIIIPFVWNFEVTTLPVVPLQLVDGTPILFGNPEIEYKNNRLIVHADIIVSSFFLLSRYEEILKPNCRDQHGRFCAKDSIIFQQGYGNRPLVDEYGVLLREWLRKVGINIPEEKQGFNKIYLTHDVDIPFRFERLTGMVKQTFKNIFHYHFSAMPLEKFMNEEFDEYNTFSEVVTYDNQFKNTLEMSKTAVNIVYFFISAGSFFNRKYYNFSSRKIERLLTFLKKTDVQFGYHASYEAGSSPQRIFREIIRLNKKLGIKTTLSRHHFLRWSAPDHVTYLERAGITDDFTMSYADAVGFRVGTCRPYRFINPYTGLLTNIVIHPLNIMECTLNNTAYMNLKYEDALRCSQKIINQVYRHNGDLSLLWHNTAFTDLDYQKKLYLAIFNYIKDLIRNNIISTGPGINKKTDAYENTNC
jgi:hypothetical protein